MRKRNKLWSYALAGALAVSNMSTVVALPMTSIVAQAAETYTDVFNIYTAAGSYKLTANNALSVNVLDQTLKIPQFTGAIPEGVAGDAHVLENDTLSIYASVDGAERALVTSHTAIASEAGDGKTSIKTESATYALGQLKAGSKITFTADYIRNNTATPISDARTIVTLVGGTAATADQLAGLITLDGESTVLKGTANEITAEYGTKDIDVFVPADATFTIKVSDGDTTLTGATDGNLTAGTGYGKPTSNSITAPKAGTYTATLYYDVDGDVQNSQAPEEVISKTVTVLPGEIASFGNITGDFTTIGTADDTGIALTVPATLNMASVGNNKVSYRVVKQEDFDAVYDARLAAYTAALNNYNDGKTSGTRNALDGEITKLATAVKTSADAVENHLSVLNAANITVTPGTVNNSNTSYSQAVKVTTGVKKQDGTWDDEKLAAEGDYYLLAYETNGLDGHIIGKYGFSVVANNTNFAIGTEVDETTGKVDEGVTLSVGKSITLKPFNGAGTQEKPAEEITSSTETAKITYSVSTNDKAYVTLNANTGELKVIKGRESKTADTHDVIVTGTYKVSANVTKTARFTVTTKDPAVTVKTDKNEGTGVVKLNVGDEQKLLAFSDLIAVSDVTWNVKDTKKEGTNIIDADYTAKDSTTASVTNGKFKATKAGYYTVFATYNPVSNYPVASTAFNVTVNPDNLELYTDYSEKEAVDATLTGYIGQTEQIYAYFGSQDYTNKVTWKSDSAVVTVDKGLITYVGKGTATVTASFKDTDGKNYEQSVSVTVMENVYELKDGDKRTTRFNQRSTMLVGDTVDLVLYKDDVVDNKTSVTWLSSAPEYLSVKNGKVTALKVYQNNQQGFGPGTYITAYNEEIGNLASYYVTIQDVGLGIYDEDGDSYTSATLKLNEETRLYAKYGHDDVSGKWSSSAPSVATVTSNGTVKAVAANGNATITFTSDDGKTATFTVTAAEAPASVTLSAEDTKNQVAIGKTTQLKVFYNNQDVTEKAVFKIVNGDTYASVDENGVVTGLSQGSVTLSATYTINDGTEHKYPSNELNITVTETVKTADVTLDKDVVTIAAEETFTLTATVAPVGTTDTLTWTSSDESIATVTDGVVKGIAEGEATITAKSGTKTDVCIVTVTKSEKQKQEEQKKAEEAEKTKSDAIAAATTAANAAASNPTDANLAALEKAIADAKAAGASDADVKAAEEKLTAALKTAKTDAQTEANNQKKAADTANSNLKTANDQLNTTKGQLDTANKTIADTAADAKLAKTLKANKNKTKTVSGTKYKTDADGGQSVAVTKGKNVKALTVKASVKISGYSYKVRALNAKAFTGKKIRTIKIAGNYLKNVDVNAFKNTKATKITITKAKAVKTQLKTAAKAAGLKYSVKGTTVTITKK